MIRENIEYILMSFIIITLGLDFISGYIGWFQKPFIERQALLLFGLVCIMWWIFETKIKQLEEKVK